MAENIDKRITGQLLSAKRATLVVMFVTPALLSLESMQPALAQTFDEASIEALRQICQGAAGEFPPTITVTSEALQFLCFRNAPQGVLSASPAAVSPQAAGGETIERRLQAVRESEERRREAASGRIMYASYPREGVLAENSQLQLPPTGGDSPEIVIGPAQGLSLFVSAGAVALNHHNNRFEDLDRPRHGVRRRLRGPAAYGDGWSRLLDHAAAAGRTCLQLHQFRRHL